MGPTEGRIGDPRAHPHQPDGEMVVATIHPHLFKGAVNGEGSNRVGERDHSPEGQPGGNADHGLFGDAHVDEPLRVLLHESGHTGRGGDVRHNQHDAIILFGQIVEGIGKGVPHEATSRSSAMAVLNSSGFGER